MRSLYQSPLRVYLLLGALVCFGFYCASLLPVSLFPNSAKPSVGVSFSYGSKTPTEFLYAYGSDLEYRLSGIKSQGLQIDQIEARYGSTNAHYQIEFEWNNSPDLALQEVTSVVNAFSARLPDEIRLTMGIWSRNENSGFFAASFYSTTRSLNELYDLIEPILGPPLAKVSDSRQATLWNPSDQEVRVELDIHKLATLGLLPKDIGAAILGSMSGQSGGSLTMGTQTILIQMPRRVQNIEDLKRIPIRTSQSRLISLSQIAKVSLEEKTTGSRSFKTSGAPSLILFAEPKPGSNVKRMSEDIKSVITRASAIFPADVQVKILVDPSDFIRSAIQNLQKEVLLGAILAVLVLFLFVGSLKNTITAAIEIPLSMVLAFILMKATGIHINLISLGGLALSAGMNVDASIVVMENIFRHFREATRRAARPLTRTEQVDLVLKAVKEVHFPIIASTACSLIVFIPLLFTKDLTAAILGDLAWAVIFSHGLSMFVALLLVPTVRLQLLKNERHFEYRSVIHGFLKALESFYLRTLEGFLNQRRQRLLLYSGVVVSLTLCIIFLLPRLPKEVMGRPETDWLFVSVNTNGNTRIKQMEYQLAELESKLLASHDADIQYTFTQAWSFNGGSIMARLKNKKDIERVWKSAEGLFKNDTVHKFSVFPWNPAELPLPDPTDLRLVLQGGTQKDQAEALEKVDQILEGKNIYPRVWTQPNVSRSLQVVFRPKATPIESAPALSPEDLTDLARVATQGKSIGLLSQGTRYFDIQLKFPDGTVSNIENLGALPVGVKGKIVPLRSFLDLSLERELPTLYRENQRELSVVLARLSEGSEKKPKQALEETQAALAGVPFPPGVTLIYENPEHDLDSALKNLLFALLTSLGLILLLLILQFGNLSSPLLVLASVPLGLLGAVVSLTVFQSTLSLNSALGMILLNGLAVANGILLVEFARRGIRSGLTPREAILAAGQKRLRPILMTSLTTILGMLPVALGWGEGGKILQPLGIVVAGGLWISMILTLYVIPGLQYDLSPRHIEDRPTPHESRPQFVSVILIFFCSLLGHPPALASEISQPLTFSEAIAHTLERSQDLKIREAQNEVSRFGSLSTRIFYTPTLDLTGRNSFYESTQGRNLEATLGMNLFSFGSDFLLASAAQTDLKRLERDRDQTVFTIEAEASRTFLNYISLEYKFAILKEITKWDQESTRIAESRFSRGLLPKQEVDKIRIDSDFNQSRMAQIQYEIEKARSATLFYLGERELVRAWPWPERLERSISVDQMTKIISSQSQLFDQRPDLASLSLEQDAQSDRARSAGLKLLPSISGQFSYGVAQGAAAVSTSPYWTATLTLSLPLFDRLSLYSQWQTERQKRMIAEASLENARRALDRDLKSSLEELRVSIESVLARRKMLELSRRLYEEAKLRFRSGRIPANEFSIDQSRYFNSELTLIDTLSSAHLSFLKFCHTTAQRVSDCRIW